MIHTWGPWGSSLRGLKPMELVTVMRSQGAQTLILSPSGPLPLQIRVSPENPFSSSEVFPEESLTCQKAAWGRPAAPASKVPRMVGTCSYLLGSQRWKKASWLQEASGILYSPSQRSRHKLLGFVQSSRVH